MVLEYSDITFAQLTTKPPSQTAVLCVNNRYARRILAQFNALLSGENNIVPIPSIVPQTAWIQNLASNLCFEENNSFASSVFNSFAAQLVWQHVIKENEANDYLLSINQMAKLAYEANNLIHEWDIRVDLLEHTLDYDRFLVWQAKYQKALKKLDAEDINLTYENIYHGLDNGAYIGGLENIVLVGFNQISPRLENLLNKLQNIGVNLYKLNNTYAKAKNIHHFQLTDLHSEWQQAAAWAKKNLIDNPKGKYAIIVPNPTENIPYIHRLMRQNLAPLGLSYNVAAAPVMSEWSIVSAINLWLNLLNEFSANRQCEASDIGKALLALSALNNKELNHWAASIDRKLRYERLSNLNYINFKFLFGNGLPGFIAKLDQCIDLIKQSKHTDINNQIDLIRNLLNILGIVDNIQLDSHAWQCLQALDQAFNSLLGLAPIFDKIDFYTTIKILRQLTQNITFQPQRDPNSRLDILGILEAEGGYWDGVWVLGLTDNVFPAQAQPNPLIPWSAMQRSNAPRSTPERELQWAKTALDNILRTAPEVCFSHAQLSGDEVLSASPLLKPWQYLEIEPEKRLLDSIKLDILFDDYGPALKIDNNDMVFLKGGVSVLDTQARNPLWAFVKFRLKAIELPYYLSGFNPIVRGIILHDCMHLIWSKLKNKDGLLNAKANSCLESIIDNAFEEVLQDLKHKQSLGFNFNSQTLYKLEADRTRKVIMQWLDIEANRAEYFIPFALEKEHQLIHNGLKLSYRIDRVDQISDGRMLLIDYKSGLTKVSIEKNWSRERPIDLQLPLYASSFDAQELAGLIFVRLNARGNDAYGLSDGDCGIESVTHYTDLGSFQDLSWSQLLQKWRDATRSLMDEYASGYAANKYLADTDIQYCDVLPFLRLQNNQNE